MSLIPTTPVETDLTAPQSAFWPEIGTAEFRARYQVDSTIGDERALAYLTAALVHINTQLAAWRVTQQAAGHATLQDIPPAADADDYGDGATGLLDQYKTAVYARAKAQQLKRARDYDSTNEGHDRADDLEVTADDYLRESYLAVRAIQGHTGLTVELI